MSSAARARGVRRPTVEHGFGSRKRGQPETMPFDRLRPDLEIVLTLDPYAPRAARHRVAQVGRPSPDLRDAIKLLCSELVSQAVEHSAEGDSIELRMWMPEDVV